MIPKSFLILAFCCVAAPLSATEDDEAAFDDALRNFGLTAGMAWQCSAEDMRESVDARTLNAYSGILRLFGSDRAFGFAASYGVGIAADIQDEDCAARIAAFEDGLASAQALETEAGQ
ncbi:MAG: hypothetical protein RIG84_12790 [Roseovarius sp.]